MFLNKNNNKSEETKKEDRWSLYNAKFKKSAIRIGLYILILIIFIFFIIGLSFYRKTLLEFDNKNINEVKQYIQTIKRKASETKNNLKLARKYSARWENATDKQKTSDGINPNLINSLLEELSTKYNIAQYNFSMSVPKIIETNKLQGKTLDILVSECDISFDIIDDVRAISFLQDLQNNLTGYGVIKVLNITKNKEKYSYQDFVAISSGKSPALMKVTIGISWYATKRKK